MNNLAKSTVFLDDGQELLCNNTVSEIREDLEKEGCANLILSEQNGIELPVHKMHIVYFVPTD